MAGLSAYEGCGKAVVRLEQALRAGRAAHAYLIEGDFNTDKEGFARAFAQALLCPVLPGVGCGRCPVCRKVADGNHEDLYWISPETKAGSQKASVRNEAVEALQGDLLTRPSGGDRNVAVIAGADTMTDRAQNRLLKTLEEPPSSAVLLLLSENRELLPPTIRSRTVGIRLAAFGAAEGNEAGMGRPGAGDDPGRPGRSQALTAASDLLRQIRQGAVFFDLKDRVDHEVKSREEAMAFLDGLESALSGGMRGESDEDERALAARGAVLVEEARRKLLRNGVPKYALRELVLKLQALVPRGSGRRIE